VTLSDIDKRIIASLQGDFPIVENPYSVLADRLGISEDLLIDRVLFLSETGILKRLSAVVRHGRVGYTSNALVVWDVADEHVEAAGRAMSDFEQVSHCYERHRNESWDFNMYTMVHAKSDDECLAIVAELSRVTGVSDYSVLFSERELKKSSVVYFKETY
jgi:siroheme decarboxylase